MVEHRGRDPAGVCRVVGAVEPIGRLRQRHGHVDVGIGHRLRVDDRPVVPSPREQAAAHLQVVVGPGPDPLERVRVAVGQREAERIPLPFAHRVATLIVSDDAPVGIHVVGEELLARAALLDHAPRPGPGSSGTVREEHPEEPRHDGDGDEQGEVPERGMHRSVVPRHAANGTPVLSPRKCLRADSRPARPEPRFAPFDHHLITNRTPPDSPPDLHR